MDIEYTPIFFPTKIAIIDDDQDFLDQVSLLLGDELVCQLYTSPDTALRDMAINTRKNHEFADMCASHIAANLNSDDPVEHSKNLHQFVTDPHRFDRFSVMVVDYSMPEMNGIEMCKQVSDPWIKKILITGKASTKVAIDAFNEGIIDYFIQKDDLNSDSQLNETISTLSAQYFSEICLPKNAGLRHSIPYLFDADFVTWFKELCKENEIVEFYLKKRELLGEFMLVNKQGQVKYLMLQTEEQTRAQFEVEDASLIEYMANLEGQLSDDKLSSTDKGQLIARSKKSTQIREQLLADIHNHRIIPYFAGLCTYSDSFEDNWQKHIFPAQQIARYTYALVEAEALADYFANKNVYSYESFMKKSYASASSV